MSSRIFLYAVLSVVLWLPSTIYGQVPCSTEECGDALGLLGPSPNLVCYVDPTDPSLFATEFYFCPCEDNYEVGGFVVYQGLDFGITTALPPYTQTLGPSLYVYAVTETYNVALTTINPDTPIEVGYSFQNLGVAEVNTYTIAQSQSIFYTGITSTLTSTANAETSMLRPSTAEFMLLTPPATTQTATEIAETVLPAATITLPCTTATQTYTAKTSTTTVTTTSTPVARTINKNIVSTVTTTLSCIPPATVTPAPAKMHRSPREEAAAALKRAQVVAYEMPRCANTPASYITIVTSTTVSTYFTTSTDTATAFATTTISTQTQPSPSTVCKDVKGSTTITPTKTKTSTVKLARSTITSITSEVVTKTVVPHGIGKCATVAPGVITTPPAVTLTIS
jgi:hypothetical protein